MKLPNMNMAQRGAALAVVTALLFMPGMALAEQTAAQKAADLAGSAKKKFVVGAFSEAAGLYEAAFNADPLPKYLYNMGMCRKKMGTSEALKKAEVNFKAVQLQTSGPLKAAAASQLEQVRQLLASEPESKPALLPEPVSEPTSPPQPVVANPALDVKPAPVVEEAQGHTPIYKKWWFWTIIGAVVVGGTVGAAVGVTQSGDDKVPGGPTFDVAEFKLGFRR